MAFFAPNIGRTGRLVRAVVGLACLTTALIVHGYSWWVCGALVAVGGFALYEAARGWCLARACGVKTKL